ncbi:ABC transporter substrate-binding protein [Cryobacterium sp. BB736]|uniref:ABC transporter substrate-binding protein n=1 Tax=Cryobacterium sp. BB736 TaxID=2746963 RepID=UPI001875A67D|nr:ABC transporter substrate-binding protein [Cryobacterium sp. BB736]
MRAPAHFAHRSIAAAAGITALTLLLAGCTPAAQQNTEPTAGGTLVYASGDAEPTCLDPHVGGNYPQALIATQYLESLVSKDADGQIIPWLATAWEPAEDGLSWKFQLRDDVTFTDGTPFNAEAVQANVEHLLDPATTSSTGYLALGKVASTDIVDEHTIRFNLSTPDSALLDSLSMPWVAIQSPTALARGMDVNCESPVGTGPFIVTDWKRQDSITLVRNDDYNSPPADAEHDGPAYLDEIVWRFIPDSASRFAALQSGQVDVIDNAQPSDIAAAEGQGITDLDAPRPGASNRIELNSGKAPFDDIRVREAFIRAADVNDGIEALFFGTADRSYSVLSSVETLGLSAEEHFGIDPDAANALLDEAGWTERDGDGYRVKNGQRLSVDFPVSTNQSIPAEQSLFEQIQAAVKQVGFEVRLKPMDLSSWYSTLIGNDYNLVSAPYTKVGPDVLRILYHSDSITPAPSGYFANLAQLNDPEVDALLTEASQVTDADERAALYAEVQELILSGFYALPLYDQQNHFLVGGNVSGLRAMPTVSTPTFYDAWLAR